MKKNKYIFIVLILSIFCSLSTTFAFFSSSTDLLSLFRTKNYYFKLNGSGGAFNSEDLTIANGKTTLPVPVKSGYTFLGYSNSTDGNTDYSINISNINQINDKEIYAKWQINTYSISYNLNGGNISGQKTTYNVEESFTIPNPTKTGNTFSGWTGSNGTTKQTSLTIPKGTTGNLSYTANWTTNSYQVDINPVIDGTTYYSGLSGYTFDVWVNGTLVADDIIDWCQNVSYGSTVRVKTNSLTGRSTDFDKTITVGASNTTIAPSWTTNSYLVDVNPVIDGTTYGSGLSGYTFDVWVNGTLVADDVIDWCQNVSYGNTVRVKTNSLTGRSTDFDKTITVGASNTTIAPSWTIGVYEGHFYYNNNIIAITNNKYGSQISTPSIGVDSLGLSSNFYYIGGYTPWTTWIQPEYAVGFTINVSEYNCAASFGSTGGSNASQQLSKVRAAGYDFCSLTDWGSIECTGNYSKVMGLYNNAWNILPRSGTGWSIYKQIGCDSGWSTYQRR
ncbi:MAG: InlB B-repeat-containing protein [Bacilli bacterium]|nr:InlB B-repeat-containing protein [Bacilli bacterium]